MSASSADRDERIRQAADQLCTQAQHVNEITRDRIMKLAGPDVSRRAFDRVFPGKQFTLLRQSWLLKHIEDAMTTVFATAQTQRDVSLHRIANLGGCHPATVMSLVGQEFLARRATLADSQQRMLQAIARLVEAKIPPREYTWRRVYDEAKERPMRINHKIKQAFRDGLETLVAYHQEQQRQRVPHATYACIQGDWINVDKPTWYLAATKKTIWHDHLRPDIAMVAWPLLQKEACTASPSAASLYFRYQGCLSIAKLLGDAIPDIRAITLDALQHVWFHSEASMWVRRHLRTMFLWMIEALIMQGTTDTTLPVQEYARVHHWLQMLRLREPMPDKASLSEAELDSVLDGCLKDILQGVAYTQQERAVVGQMTTDIHAERAEPVLHWGIALIILVMAFTGLRRQSIARLTTKDLAQIGPHAFALAWRHAKPGKQCIAVIPALVAEHLHYYIRTTTPLRERLGTQDIFFARNFLGCWDHMTINRITCAFESFVFRHALNRDGAPFHLGSTLLRRTYVTRALYELPHISVLQAQLGHVDPRTTFGYAQHDRFEHPAQVDHALDTFGRKVLIRWQAPLLLDDLPDRERQTLLGARLAHDQDVGMCRHDCCIKLNNDRVPPCSLCEHLVSGPEYFVAWEREKSFRELQLERVAMTPGAEPLFAQLKGQYDRFLANYQFLQERSQG